MRKKDYRDELYLKFCNNEKININSLRAIYFVPLWKILPGYHNPEEIDREIEHDFYYPKRTKNDFK